MKPIYLTPSLARSLLATYRQLQEKGADEDFSLEDFKRILISFAKSLPDLQDKSFEAIIQYLGILAASRDEMDKAVMPPELARIIEEYEEYQKLHSIPKHQRTPDDESRLAIKTLTLKREIDRLEQKQQEVVYQASQTSKIEPGTQELDQWVRAQDLTQRRISLTRALEEQGLPAQNAETIAKDVIAHIQENPEAFQGTISRFISDAIRQINPSIAPTSVQEAAEAASTAVFQTTKPTKEQNIFQIDQPLPPIRRTMYSPSQTENVEPRGMGVEKKEELPEAIKQLESSILLRTRRGPAWKKILDDFTSSLFGSSSKVEKHHQATFDQAITRLQIENPRFYSENFVSLQTIRNNLQNLFSPQVPLEQIVVVPPENLKEAAQTLDRVADQLVAVTADTKNNSAEKRVLSLAEIQRIIPQQTRDKQSRVAPFLQKEVTARVQDISSYGEIKIRESYLNIGRALSGFFSTGTGQVFAPVPASAGRTDAGGTVTGSALGGLASLQALNRSFRGISGLTTSIKLGPVGWAMISVFAVAGAIMLLTYMSITGSQGIFQATSAGDIPESKYIGVSKSAQPSQLSNNQLPLDVKYTITITAKEARLENLSFKDQFSVFSKGSPGTPTSNVSSFDTAPLETGQSRTFSYNLRFEPDFKDSVVTNTFTVTANPVDGPKGETFSKSASVIIGNPPSECFEFRGFSANEQARLTAQIAKILRYTTYVADLCKSGVIPVIRTSRSPGWSGEVVYPNIYLHMDNVRDGKKPLSFDVNLYYTLAHETGHVYQHRNDQVYEKFKERSPWKDKGHIPTYTLEKEPKEDFAEMIAIYIIRHEVREFGGYYIFDMQTLYRKHYDFAKEFIFKGLD